MTEFPVYTMPSTIRSRVIVVAFDFSFWSTLLLYLLSTINIFSMGTTEHIHKKAYNMNTNNIFWEMILREYMCL